jgi:hypothetical protein
LLQELIEDILTDGTLEDLESVFASPRVRQKITEKDFYRFWKGLQRSIPNWEILEMILSLLRQEYPIYLIQKKVGKILENPPFAF